MITARGRKGDKEFILIGLSRENVQRLTNGHPILMHSELHRAIPENWMVMIMFGETEQQMQADLEKAGAIDAHTLIHAEKEP